MNFPKLNPYNFVPSYVIREARRRKEREAIPHPQITVSKKKEETK